MILDRTPFYGESGGQVGDTGELTAGGFCAEVSDTKKTKDGHYLHSVVGKSGAVSVGDTVRAAIDSDKRTAIRRNHTAVHILQAALRQVLGDHVEQAGSYVDAERLRFDFKHFSAMTPQELSQVETLVNSKLLEGLEVTTTVTDIETAKKMGAMALFGEKYGKSVRMVKVGDFSAELCGGTHIDNSAKIGLFKIVSEMGVSAGVRRIEAVTGANVLKLIYDNEKTLSDAAASLKLANASELARRCEQVMSELRERDREIEELNSELARKNVEGIASGAKEVGGLKIFTSLLKNTANDTMRDMCDKLKSESPNCVACFISDNGDSASVVVAAGKEALGLGIHAGKLAGAVAAIAGGKGGGRPDFAMAGAKNMTKLADALAGVESLALAQVK